MRTTALSFIVLSLLTSALARAEEAVPAAATAPAATPPAVAVEQKPVVAADARTTARGLYKEASDEYAKGNYGSALERLDQAFALHDAPTLLLARAHTLDKLGKRNDAARAYTAYLRRRPDDPDAPAIRARVSELGQAPAAEPGTNRTAALLPTPASPAVTGQDAGEGVVDTGAEEPEEEDKPRLNEKRRRDQLFFFRAGATGGIGSGTVGEYIPMDAGFGYSSSERRKRDTSPSLAGVSVAAGVTPIPGFSIAAGLTAGYLSSTTEAPSLPPGVADEESHDHSGGVLMPELEVHGFPFTRGPLHLMASGGLLTGGGDDVSDFFGVTGGLGIGGAFFVGDQTSIDVLARGRYMPDGDHESSMLLWSLDVGVLLQ